MKLDISQYLSSCTKPQMPPSIRSLNGFMEKNKNKQPIKGCTDDLAIVKAAAWAWYEHGSGSVGKPVCEFDTKRTRQVARPSRYRLEAMRTMEDSMEGSKTPSSVHMENSLLDTYEIESISRQLDYLMSSSGNMFDAKLLDRNLPRQQTVSSEGDLVAVKKKKKKIFGKVLVGAWSSVWNNARHGYKSPWRLAGGSREGMCG